MNTYKTCTRCLTAKPRTAEYFYKQKQYLTCGECDGLQPYCKECSDGIRLEHRLNNYEHELQRGRDNNMRWREENREYSRQYRREQYRRKKMEAGN